MARLGYEDDDEVDVDSMVVDEYVGVEGEDEGEEAPELETWIDEPELGIRSVKVGAVGCNPPPILPNDVAVPLALEPDEVPVRAGPVAAFEVLENTGGGWAVDDDGLEPGDGLSMSLSVDVEETRPDEVVGRDVES